PWGSVHTWLGRCLRCLLFLASTAAVFPFLAKHALEVGEAVLYVVRNHLHAGVVIEPEPKDLLVAPFRQQLRVLLEGLAEVALHAFAPVLRRRRRAAALARLLGWLALLPGHDRSPCISPHTTSPQY